MNPDFIQAFVDDLLENGWLDTIEDDALEHLLVRIAEADMVAPIDLITAAQERHIPIPKSLRP